jgi:hypothetical protein
MEIVIIRIILFGGFSANKLSCEWKWQILLAGTWQTILFLKIEGKQPNK